MLVPLHVLTSLQTSLSLNPNPQQEDGLSLTVLLVNVVCLELKLNAKYCHVLYRSYILTRGSFDSDVTD